MNKYTYDNMSEINGVKKTRVEHYANVLPRWTKFMRIFGEAGTVRTGKDGKVGDVVFSKSGKYNAAAVEAGFNKAITGDFIVAQKTVLKN